MTGLYLFAAAVGVPLLVWFLLSGGDDGGDAGGEGSSGDGVGGLMLRVLPLSTVAMVAASFGVGGLALGLAGTAPGTTFVAATAVAVLAGVLNSTVFAYLRRSESTTAVSDAQVAGAVGRVVVPVADGRRGRIAISAGGQQIYLSALAMPDAADDGVLEAGTPVLVVEMHDGVAVVTRLDPELA